MDKFDYLDRKMDKHDFFTKCFARRIGNDDNTRERNVRLT